MKPATDRERWRREAEFFNEVFINENHAGSAREKTDKFYSVSKASKAFFRNYLVSHCGARVLEYGCGPDTHAKLLNPKGAAVTGIDISPVALARRRELARRQDLHPVHACVMSGEQLGFAARSFDLICGMGILHHLNLDLCFEELRRVLKPTGSAIFIEPMGHNPLVNLYRTLTPAMRTVDEHPLKVADFEKAREHFGRLETTYFHLTSLATVPFRNFSWFRRTLRFTEELDNALFRLLPWLGRHAWAVVMVVSEPKAGAHSPGRGN